MKSHPAKEQFDLYLELLLKWNARFNLTAITDPDEIQTRHFDDSLESHELVRGASTLIDLGTGAGFPGIPLKIVDPHLDVVLLDATRKKISFVSEVIRTLKLEGIRAVQGRAEDPEIYRMLGTFDVVISRATWPLTVFLEISLPYFDESGTCIAMRGSNWKRELEDSHSIIARHGLKLASTHPYTIGDDEARCVIVFKR